MLTLFFKFHIMYYTTFIKNFQIGLGGIMGNNLFYARGNEQKGNNREFKRSKDEKLSFKKRKENTLASLNEVENFLFNYKHFMKYVKLYKFFRP